MSARKKKRDILGHERLQMLCFFAPTQHHLACGFLLSYIKAQCHFDIPLYSLSPCLALDMPSLTINGLKGHCPSLRRHVFDTWLLFISPE